MDNVILESIRTGDIVVIDGFSEMGKGKEVVIIKEQWANIDTGEIKFTGLTVRDHKEIKFMKNAVISVLKELKEVTEVDLSKCEKQSEIYSLFYSWFQELYAEHQIEGARDNLITLLERAANARLDEL